MIRKHRKFRDVREKRLCDHKEDGEITERVADIFSGAIALCTLFDKGIFSARGLRMQDESLDKRTPRGNAPNKLAKAEAEGKKEHHRRSFLRACQSAEYPKERESFEESHNRKNAEFTPGVFKMRRKIARKAQGYCKKRISDKIGQNVDYGNVGVKKEYRGNRRNSEPEVLARLFRLQ